MTSRLIEDFVSLIRARGDDLPIAAVSDVAESVVVLVPTDDPGQITRYGFVQGPSLGLPDDPMEAVVRHLEAGGPNRTHAVAALVEAVRVRHVGEGVDMLVFEGGYLDPTTIIPIHRCAGGFEVEDSVLPLDEAVRTAAAAACQARKDHESHRKAAQESGYWGAQGSGCIVVARSTGRVLVGLRSDEVMEPFTWGTFGGAIDEDLTPEQMARKELRQETGYRGPAEMVPLYEFRAPGGTFRYQNFAAVVEDEYEPELSWEHEEIRWFGLDELPDDLHFGLEALLDDPASLEFLRSFGNGRRPSP